MRDALRQWFERAARPLPWRDGRVDAYRCLVVETMSQQTAIGTVAARLPGFLARFPDLASLAVAPLDDVLAAWAGLGYYRRARALHALAQRVVADHGGVLPSTPAALQALPGVGAYTAAAIAAQAYGVPGIAVDGNVRRVGARLLAETTPSLERVQTALGVLLLEPAEAVPEGVATTRDGARSRRGPPAEDAFVAEALVELGATVCTPRAPACERCPLRPACRAAQTPDPTRFPAPKRRPAPRAWTLHGWLVRRAGPAAGGPPLVALERRPETGPWGGLHGLPWRDAPPVGSRLVGTFTHVLTHRRVEASVWAATSAPLGAALRWASALDLDGLGIAEIDRRALALEPVVANAPVTTP
jgi:A/G-specific adenine glycosylase